MFASIYRTLFGSPLPTHAEAHHRLTKVKALAVFSSDALSSVAYAPEEILLVLVMGGSAALGLSVPIAAAIVVLLAIVATSYYQTIHGYPSGGGAYIVAIDNLGVWPGLVAAAALLIGYVLTVAVSITAGVLAMTSAFPALVPYGVTLSLLAIALIAWANLRGVRESGTIFAVPTYAFIVVFVGLIVVGLARLAAGSIDPLPPATPVRLGAESLGLLLVVRAFASGTAALTGVEAISNGIPAFHKPESDNAGKTLIAMAVLLGVMFLGITVVARGLNVVPTGGETVISQIGRRLFGGGALYLILQVATALILILAANTSFADFPRLSAILARDRFLPRQLASLGDRLVFANGIITLAFLAGVLVVVFGGHPHRLIPLYAVGVFLAFTLSQAGMVRHWLKQRGQGWRWKMAVNSLGALTTGAVTLVVGATKFTQGAWIVIVVLPLFVHAFYTIRRHYDTAADQLSLEHAQHETWTDLASSARRKVVVPVSGMHRGTLKALHFARSLSSDVTAVIVDVEKPVTDRVREKWAAWGGDVPLEVLASPYRSTVGPLLDYLVATDRRDPERGLAVVILPEFVPARWWHHLLHNQNALLLKAALVYRRSEDGIGRVVVDVPYHLHR